MGSTGKLNLTHSVAELMNEPIGDSGKPWEGDVDSGAGMTFSRATLTDSEFDSLQKRYTSLMAKDKPSQAAVIRLRRDLGNARDIASKEQQVEIDRWLDSMRDI